MNSQAPQTLNGLFLDAVENHPKAQAILHKKEGRFVPVSSEELRRQVAALCFRLGAQGIGPGDRFAILSENRLEWLVTDFAVMGLGAVNVPLYPTLPQQDVEYILRDSEAKGILVSTEEQLEKILNVWPRLPHLKCAVVADAVSTSDSLVRAWSDLAQPSAEDFEDHCRRFRQQSRLAQPSDLATLLYTSGTTGQPKGVQLTHANIVSNVLATAPLFSLNDKDVAMSFLPLSHILERTLDYYYFFRNVTIAYAENLEALATNLVEVRPTVMAVVPRVFEKVHSRIKATVDAGPPSKKKLFSWAENIGKEYYPYRLGMRKEPAPLGLRLRWKLADALVASKVRRRLGGRIKLLFCGSAPLTKELADFFYGMGLMICEGYGLTETSPVISLNYPGHIKLGTVGPTLPGVEVKLAEPENEEAEGREILVRGPNVTSGYYRLEEENRSAFVNGWFRTGDLGKMDEDGYLIITGRKKNLLKTSGGKYVAPEKIENLFQGHPFVAQIFTLGDGRKFVAALVVPNFIRLESWAQSEGLRFSTRKELISLPEVVSLMEGQVKETTQALAPFEQIRQIALLPEEFTIDSGELSPTQKIKRPVVEGRHRELIEEIYRRRRPDA